MRVCDQGREQEALSKKAGEFQLFSNINLAFNLPLPSPGNTFYSLIKSQGLREVDDVLVKTRAKGENLRVAGEFCEPEDLMCYFRYLESMSVVYWCE